jgi:pimeloyl-ACP methyl ester carboxylesterase
MPAVFVHGNPETAAIWDDLLPQLPRNDVVTLSPPGFGAPVPDGFNATADEYRDWLGRELERIDGPIDLVGHDWGGAHVMRISMERPELIRSWATDVLGLFDPDYVWHGHGAGMADAGCWRAVRGPGSGGLSRGARPAVRVTRNEQRCRSQDRG